MNHEISDFLLRARVITVYNFLLLLLLRVLVVRDFGTDPYQGQLPFSMQSTVDVRCSCETRIQYVVLMKPLTPWRAKRNITHQRTKSHL